MKPIDDFVDVEKESDSKAGQSRSEAMTLEEMAVKAQERKILGSERKVDMNIIIFVSLCLCGLVIINVVLYFLVGNNDPRNASIVTQDARGLLEERRKEREALLADAASSDDIIEPADIADQLSDLEPAQDDLANPSDSLVLIEDSSLVEGSSLLVEDTLLEDGSLPVDDSTQAEGAELVVESVQDSSVAGSAASSDVVEPESEDIPFDIVISVGSVINDWSNAWAAQDVDTYLAYYADTFVSEAGMNIEEWRAHRKGRLTKPEWISIGISKLRILPTDDGARAEFIQDYNASNYSDKELKKMIFKRVDGEWRIFDERATQVK